MSKLGELRELRLLANRQIRNRRLRLTLFFPNERPGNGLMRAQSLTVRSNVGFGLNVIFSLAREQVRVPIEPMVDNFDCDFVYVATLEVIHVGVVLNSYLSTP